MKKRSGSKRILFILIATGAVIIFSYLTHRMFSVSSFAFAWVINFSLMTWYMYVDSLLPFTLKGNYFNPKQFEKDGEIYKYAGINIYRKLLVWTGWEKFTRKKNPWKTDISSLEKREYNTRSSEVGHLVIAFIIILSTIVFTSTLAAAKWLIATNILLNIYPVMLQRYNRPRYRKIIKEKRKKTLDDINAQFQSHLKQ